MELVQRADGEEELERAGALACSPASPAPLSLPPPSSTPALSLPPRAPLASPSVRRHRHRHRHRHKRRHRHRHRHTDTNTDTQTHRHRHRHRHRRMLLVTEKAAGGSGGRAALLSSRS
eukprot:3629810-Rhodomonas_salina.1